MMQGYTSIFFTQLLTAANILREIYFKYFINWMIF